MGELLPSVLISEEQIRARVAELAADIERDHAAGEELLLVGVLRGSFIFLADLARALTMPRCIDFIALSSYENRTTSDGGVRLIMDVRVSVTNRHVLVVEDIVDSGHTLRYLMKAFTARRPASLRSCVLVRKPERLQVEVDVDYLGFDIPDRWVVGYGLDWANRYRALPYIGIVEPDGG
ncbi:MAG: hypoxanthine phosphoribosyltransferase [Gemmatimonadota bacterium]